jgi:hypothetical protein
LRGAPRSETIDPMQRVPVRAALVLLAFCLLAPSARADALNTLQDLAQRHLRPAPLVPTAAPRPLDDLGVTLAPSPSRRKSGYGLRLVHSTSSGPDAIIALSRGDYTSMRAALREHRRSGYRVRRTRVRGRRGFLAVRKGDVRDMVLLWREGGRVYWMGSGTPRKVSVRGMRATAAKLEPLGSNYIGSFFAEGTDNTSLGAVLVTTQRHVTGAIDFGTDACTLNGFPAAAHGGTATFTMLPTPGGAFSLPLNGPLVTPGGWNGTLSGRLTGPTVDVTLQGSGTFDDGIACDTGPMSVSAPRRDPI